MNIDVGWRGDAAPEHRIRFRGIENEGRRKAANGNADKQKSTHFLIQIKQCYARPEMPIISGGFTCAPNGPAMLAGYGGAADPTEGGESRLGVSRSIEQNQLTAKARATRVPILTQHHHG